MKRRSAKGLGVGVLPDAELKRAIELRWINASRSISESQIQPASIDLRLGATAFQLKASFLPFQEPVVKRLKQADLTDPSLVLDEFSLEVGATLQRGVVY